MAEQNLETVSGIIIFEDQMLATEASPLAQFTSLEENISAKEEKTLVKQLRNGEEIFGIRKTHADGTYALNLHPICVTPCPIRQAPASRLGATPPVLFCVPTIMIEIGPCAATIFPMTRKGAI